MAGDLGGGLPFLYQLLESGVWNKGRGSRSICSSSIAIITGTCLPVASLLFDGPRKTWLISSISVAR